MERQGASHNLRLPALLVCALVFVGCLVLGFSGVVPMPQVTITWPTANGTDRYVPRPGDIAGRELVMVVLVASSCAASNDRTLPDIIERAKMSLRNQARNRGLLFSVVGVAVDRRVPDGVAHLKRFGDFDEIMTGLSWLGTGPRRFYFEHLPGPASTPQVLAYERNVHLPTPATPNIVPSVSSPFVIVRKSGLKAIKAWVRMGAPVNLGPGSSQPDTEQQTD